MVAGGRSPRDFRPACRRACRAPVARVDVVPDGFVERRRAAAADRRLPPPRDGRRTARRPFVEEWKPLPPRLHDFVEVERDRRRAALRGRAARGDQRRRRAVDRHRSRGSTRLRRRRSAPGCRRRTSGSSRPRRGCSSAQSRSSGTGPRASTRTAARDSRSSRAAARWGAEGSEWYVDGGPQEPGYSLKLLLLGGGHGALVADRLPAGGRPAVTEAARTGSVSSRRRRCSRRRSPGCCSATSEPT